MLKTILDAFSWHSLQRMPALSAEFWSKVKVRWRHNAGFVAAAAAGSIGLVLAVVLGIQGAYRLLEGEPAGDDLTEGSPSAVLGDPDFGFADTPNERLDPWEEPRPLTDRSVSHAKRKVRVIDEPTNDFDEEADLTSELAKEIATRGTKTKKQDPFAEDDDQEVEAQPVSVKPRSRHLLDENPLAEEEELPRKTVHFPVEVADEMEKDETDVEPATVAAKSPANKSIGEKSVTLPSNTGPAFEADEPEDKEDDEAEISSASAPPAENRNPAPPAGWKHPLARPEPAAEPSPAIAQKSRAVETVIYATPDADTPTTVDQTAATDADDDVAPSRLALEIGGPRAARTGETCNFEIRVKNSGRTAVEKIVLSVELPAELVHDVAQALEQKIESIGPGKTYRALVRTRAKAAGKATLKSDVAIQGRVDAKSSATIEIGSASGARVKASTTSRN